MSTRARTPQGKLGQLEYVASLPEAVEASYVKIQIFGPWIFSQGVFLGRF